MKGKPRILLIEDIASMSMLYANQLANAGYAVEISETGSDAIAYLEANENLIVLLDLQLPDMDGFELLERYADKHGNAYIVITSDGSVSRAVDAMRLGAYDFLVKPFSEQRLITTLANARERMRLQNTVECLSKTLNRDRYYGFVGSSPAMRAIYESIENVAHSDAAIFITGESGTGKEVCARAIHEVSSRKNKAFVAINCGAIPSELIESEIFGHVRGAFTGALGDREGAAMRAHGGTFFLDEICEMDVLLQTKLLRFLQSKKVQRVGSDSLEDVDVRIICATNRDPIEAMAQNLFREDLYYRLNVIPIHLPPLRNRGNDIIEIATFFLDDFGSVEGKIFKKFDIQAMQHLKSQAWKGNVRELQNVIRRLVVLNPSSEVILKEMLLDPVEDSSKKSNDNHLKLHQQENNCIDISCQLSLQQAERVFIEAVIETFENNITLAARQLEVSPSTLYRKRDAWAKQDSQT